MCLYARHHTAVIAKKDLICYKIVNLKDHTEKSVYEYAEDGKIKTINYKLEKLPEPIFRSLFYNFVYKLGETYFCDAFESEVQPHMCQVTQGFHSYQDIKYTGICCADDDNEVILKCIIPRGTKYFYGYTTYCSQTIRIIAWKCKGGRWHKCQDYPSLLSKMLKAIKNIYIHFN